MNTYRSKERFYKAFDRLTLTKRLNVLLWYFFHRARYRRFIKAWEYGKSMIFAYRDSNVK